MASERSDQEIREHVEAQLDSMSYEQVMNMVNYDPDLDHILHKAIDIRDH